MADPWLLMIVLVVALLTAGNSESHCEHQYCFFCGDHVEFQCEDGKDDGVEIETEAN